MVSDAVRRLLHFCFVHNWGTLTMPTGWSRVMRVKNRLMLPYLASIGLVLQMAGSGASAQNAPDQQNPRTQTCDQVEATYGIFTELKVPALRDAFTTGRGHFGTAPRAREDQPAKDPGSSFKNGAEWVSNILIPAIEQGNAELQPENVAFQLDLNLDPRSTNHAHADFWLAEMGEGQRAQGPRYSIN